MVLFEVKYKTITFFLTPTSLCLSLKPHPSQPRRKLLEYLIKIPKFPKICDKKWWWGRVIKFIKTKMRFIFFFQPKSKCFNWSQCQRKEVKNCGFNKSACDLIWWTSKLPVLLSPVRAKIRGENLKKKFFFFSQMFNLTTSLKVSA